MTLIQREHRKATFWYAAFLSALALLLLTPAQSYGARKPRVALLSVSADNTVCVRVSRLGKRRARRRTQLNVFKSLGFNGTYTVVKSVNRPRRRVRVCATLPAGINLIKATAVRRGRALESSPIAVSLSEPSDDGGTTDPPPPPPGGNYHPDNVVLAAGQSQCPSAAVATILSDTNAYRSAHGLPALSVDNRLAWAAKQHAVNMARDNNFTHTGGIGLVQQTGYYFAHYSQNIARIYHYLDVVDAWMGSESHRNNILSSSPVHIGIGCVIGADGDFWYAVDHGREM